MLMSSPIDCWRSLIAEVRRRFREIRDCRSCYKIGLEPPDPPGPDDIFIATPIDDDLWRVHHVAGPMTDDEFDGFAKGILDNQPVDLNKEKIN